jgi:dihydroorotase
MNVRIFFEEFVSIVLAGVKFSPAILFLPLAFAQDYDLLLKGGHVIDGKNKLSAVRDVAIKDGRIAEVAANIAPSKAHKVIDVAGLYVTPGLVDIHTHVYAGTGRRGAYDGDNSVYPDGFTFRSGVTTVVDAGCSGWRNFPDFKDRVIDRARTRVLALLNIVGSGMVASRWSRTWKIWIRNLPRTWR